ncbi:MAG: hypothetical protein RR932_06150 [Acinetobacter sp.]
MSNYQDMANEIAYASDMTWSSLSFYTEERAKLSDSQIFSLSTRIYETAYAADVEMGQRVNITSESANLSDYAYGIKYGAFTVNESAKLHDHLLTGFQSLTEETTYASDQLSFAVSHRTIESAKAVDAAFGVRRVASVVHESAKLSDTSFIYFHYRALELAQLADQPSSIKHASGWITETAMAADADFSAMQVQSSVREKAMASDTAFGVKHVRHQVQEWAFLEDLLLHDELTGQAWTANTGNWAMSRYTPFNFEGVAVINEQLVFWNTDGVHVAGQQGEVINSRLTTGRLDFGEQLAHPNAAYLEYSCSGAKSVAVDVTTTQSGQAQTYSYLMPQETADQLTNGRAVFGRGLRGRHFSFNISIQGSAAHINALSFDFTQTKRRI